MEVGAEWFKGFTADFQNIDAWREYHSSFKNKKKTLKDRANPSQLGDHVSLKAETTDSKPTDQDRGAQSASTPTSHSSGKAQKEQRPTLSKLAKDTTIGDPVSLESEEVVESSSRSNTAPPSPATESNVSPVPSSSETQPPMLRIDGESLFWAMMNASRSPDPYIFPALQRLHKQSPRPIIGGLSNTINFPPNHPWSKQSRAFNLQDHFDVFTASADVGMRKPSREIYELAIKRLDDFDRERGGNGVEAGDIVFLDDIGENLKAGKDVGMKTIRVQLGKTWRAVKELEGVLGVELMDEKTRRAKL